MKIIFIISIVYLLMDKYIYKLTHIDSNIHMNCIYYVTIDNLGQIIINKKNNNKYLIDVIFWENTEINSFDSVELLNEFLIIQGLPVIDLEKTVNKNC